MRFLSLLMMIFISTYSFAQTQQGYYITNNNNRVDGYFKNTNFYDSNNLKFKNDTGGEFVTLSPNEIKEYGVGSEFKFVKYTVKIDKSENHNLRMYSSVKDPQYATEIHFLNVLVQGEYASLYSVEVNKSPRYFYTLADKDEPTQLIFKKYLLSQGVTAINKEYQNQLYQNINCKNESVEKFAGVDYKRNELIEIFKEFNTCKGSQPIVYENKGGNKSKIIISAFIGVNNNTLTIKGERLPEASGSSISYGLGGEIGFLTPSGNWEFFLRAEYEKLSGETTAFVKKSYNEETTIASVDAYVLNVHVGPRYHFTLNEKSKLFLDAAIGLNSPSGDYEVQVMVQPNVGSAYQAVLNKYSMDSSVSYNFGIGYTFNNWGVRLQYETPREMFDSPLLNISSDISRYGINLRYTFN